jgi:hypothetical protein
MAATETEIRDWLSHLVACARWGYRERTMNGEFTPEKAAKLREVSNAAAKWLEPKPIDPALERAEIEGFNL